MRIAALIARILLGLVFLVFGLNGFLQFMKAPPLPGVAGQFMGAMFASHYVYLISGVQAIGGILLLVNKFVPLALVLLAAELANILVFHLTMLPAGIAIAIVCCLFWLIVANQHKAALNPLFRP